MCNTAVTFRCQIEHLIFKGISIQWPAMTENNRLSFAPIFIINLRTIFGNNIRHFKKLLFQQKEHRYFSVCDFGSTTTSKLLKTQIKNTTLTAQLQNKKVKIQLPTYTPAYYKKSKTTYKKQQNSITNLTSITSAIAFVTILIFKVVESSRSGLCKATPPVNFRFQSHSIGFRYFDYDTKIL